MAFLIWLLSFSMFSKFIRLCWSMKQFCSFLWLQNIPFDSYIPHYVSMFIRWWTRVCSHLLAVKNDAVLSIDVPVFVCIEYIFHSLVYIPRRGISDSRGNSVLNFLRNCPTSFPSDCTNLHSLQQRLKVSVSSHPHQRLLLSIFLGFVCISLVADEHLFLCFFAICLFPLERHLFSSFAHF